MTNQRATHVSWIHRFAALVAVMTFLLILVGALVSASNALWIAPQRGGPVGNPTSPTNPLLKYGTAYWFMAVAVSLLMLILVFGLWKSRVDRYLKILAGITIGILIAGIFLGFIPVFGRLSTIHSHANTVGVQILFCLTVCLALFTRSDWRWDQAKATDIVSPSLRQILVFTTGAVFLQTILGEAISRKAMRVAPHLILGIILTACAMWVLEMALTKFAHLAEFRLSAIFLAELVGLELFLGIISYSMDLNAQAISASQPGVAVMKVTHAAVGELVLATCLFVTFQAFKYLAPTERAVSAVRFQENEELNSPD